MSAPTTAAMSATPATPATSATSATPSAGTAGAAGTQHMTMAPVTSASLGGAPALAASGGVGGAVGMGAAGASGSVAGAAGASGSRETAACVKGEVKASEVVFVGESFIAQTGEIPRQLAMLAQKAGTIGPSESYRSFAVSGTQLTTGEIPGQFDRAAMDEPVKVVLMDGAGNDLLFGDRCKTFDDKCKEVIDVVSKMFTTFKSNGVKDVVYFFYPDPMGIGAQIKDAMDVLRPEMKKQCDGATEVRCIWVDQRESWMDHYSEFTSDGIHPTTAGAEASAKQIWDAMVASCVAQ